MIDVRMRLEKVLYAKAKALSRLQTGFCVPSVDNCLISMGAHVRSPTTFRHEATVVHCTIPLCPIACSREDIDSSAERVPEEDGGSDRQNSKQESFAMRFLRRASCGLIAGS